MSTPASNNHTTRAEHAIFTLGDLHVTIAKSDLSKQKKAEWRSAIKRTDELVGHGNLDLPLDRELIFKRLRPLSAAVAGMGENSFANMKYRLGAALRWAEPNLERPRSRHKLDGAWAALWAALPVGDQRSLSRLIHHADREGWSTESLSDQHIERFAASLRDMAMVVHWEDVVRGTIRCWNRLAASGQHGALPLLTPPPRKRTPYWIDVMQWPEGLHQDMDKVLAHLANPPLRARKTVRPIKASTIGQYRHVIVTLVSAMTANGVELQSITRMADAVTPDHVESAIEFLRNRSNGRVTAHIRKFAARVRNIAEWCGLPAEDLNELDLMCANARALCEEPQGLTAKNTELLDRLDDQRFSDLVHLLPELLLEQAKKRSNRRSPALARSALVIELLLTCSVRRENLVTLRLDHSIKKIGAPPNARWVIDIPAEEVKNGQPLRFLLPRSTAKLLETYLADWRPKLCKVPSSWLFPSADGGCMSPHSMTMRIREHSELILGVPITPHQFRHLSVEIYLKDNPDGFQIVGQHLGHRGSDTARTFYARSKQREATARYQERVLRARSEAEVRVRRGRRHRARGGIDAEDIL